MSAQRAVNEYVGNSPFAFVSLTGYVITPERTLPDGVSRVTVGVAITPASVTPTIVPLTSIEPPTRSDDFITPSTRVVAMSPLTANVD